MQPPYLSRAFSIFFAVASTSAPVCAEVKISRQNSTITPQQALSGFLSQPDGQYLMNGRTTVEEFADRLRHRAMAFDLDGHPGLGAEDIVLAGQVATALSAAQYERDMLQYDLDGDGAMSRVEAEVAGRHRASQNMLLGGMEVLPDTQTRTKVAAKITARYMDADQNGDGRVTVTEYAISNNPNMADFTIGFQAPAGALIAESDADADGIASEDEVTAWAHQMASRADTDMDGRLNSADIQQLARAVREALQPVPEPDQSAAKAASQGCSLGHAEPGTELFAVGGYEGSAYASIVTQSKERVTVADIILPAGEKPVHLITQFQQAVVLRISGASDRLKVVTNVGAGLALQGVSKDQLARMSRELCHVPIWEGAVKDDEAQKVLLDHLFDETPSRTIVAYTIGAADLGTGANVIDKPLTGAIDPGYSGAAALVWKDLVTYNPGGFVEVGTELVTNDTFVTPNIWPGAAGLAKLLDEGSVTRPDMTNATISVKESAPGVVILGDDTFIPGLGDDTILFGGLEYMEDRPGVWVGRMRPRYVVHRKIAFPVGLDGRAKGTFIIAKGVDMPDGDPAGNFVLRETDD